MPMEYHAADLLHALAEAAITLHAAFPRVTARKLDAEDFRLLTLAIDAALVARNEDDVRLTARMYGGFVPGSYRGEATSDEAYVEIDLRWMEVTAAGVRRGHAQRRSGGRGSLYTVRLAREGQSDGRIVNV